MKTKTLLALAVVLVGCASDPSKQPKQPSAQQDTPPPIDQAMTQQEKRIEDRKSDAYDVTTSSQQRAKGQPDMTVERQTFEVDARARLAKVQARIEEARQHLRLAGGEAPTYLQDLLVQTSRLASDVTEQVSHVSRVSSDRWPSEKSLVEGQLRDLELAADKLRSTVER